MESVTSSNYVIRDIKEEDCGHVMAMSYELADDLNERHRVTNTVDGLREDIFGDPRKCFCIVIDHLDAVEATNRLVGYSIFSQSYSVYQGLYVTLNSIYVRHDHRGKGLGKKLYQAVAQKAIELDSQRMDNTVLFSNKGAMTFYKKMGAVDLTEVGGRHKMRMTRKSMEILVKT